MDRQPVYETNTIDHALSRELEKRRTGINSDPASDLRTESQEQRELEEFEHIETRAIQRKYLFNRPRALQYTYRGNVISATEEVESSIAADLSRQGSGNSSQRFNHIDIRGIEKSRERVDLFIDLIWVGVISNLTEVFSSLFFGEGGQHGLATLVFIITYLPTWRIWNILRSFMNDYYMDDLMQRWFVFWILVLSVFYGNNLAYLTDDIASLKSVCIALYLIIRGSFLIMEIFYSFYITWLRRLILLGVLLMLPVTALWVSAIYIDGLKAIIPILIALVYEYMVPAFMDNDRFTNKLIPSDYSKEIDRVHLTTRFNSFFIITVGEGVLQLISRGPLGRGISGTAGIAVWALSIYFILAFTYFNRDSSKTVVPAVQRKGWRTLFWISAHVPLFAAFITLSAAIMFLLREIPLNAYNYDTQHQAEEVPEEEKNNFRISAIWCVGASLSMILFSMTTIALLDKPLDQPGTLVINNRYARLSGRLVLVVVILCAPINDNISTVLYLGICGIGCTLMVTWEFIGSLGRGGGLREPKGLTAILQTDKKTWRRRKDRDAATPQISQPQS